MVCKHLGRIRPENVRGEGREREGGDGGGEGGGDGGDTEGRRG